MKSKERQTGLAKLLILIIVTVLILSYLGINIQKIAESETGQANFSYLWEIIRKIGDWLFDLYQQYLSSYLEEPWLNIKKVFIK